MVSSVPKTNHSRDRDPDPTRESLVVSSTQSVPLLGAIRSSSLGPLQNWVFSLLFVPSILRRLGRSCRLLSDHQCNQENGRFDEWLVQSGGREVLRTLSSLKLSGLEVGELTQRLGNLRKKRLERELEKGDDHSYRSFGRLRQRILRSHGKRGRGSKSSPFGRQKRNYPSGDTF